MYRKIYKDLSAKYYQNNKEKLQKRACETYQSLYGCERFKNLSEDEKQKPVEYRKKYKIRKNNLL